MLKINAPPSKSYTLRGMVLAALSDKPTLLTNPLYCEDTEVLTNALERMGVKAEKRGDDLLLIPPDRLRAPTKPVFLGNSGAALRFLIAMSLLIDGDLSLTGTDALMRRPSPALISALRSLGAAVLEEEISDCPPLRITLPKHPAKRDVEIDPSVSGQQVSALLLVASRLPEGLAVKLTKPPPSEPYIEMTVDALKAFGVSVERPRNLTYEVQHATPSCSEYRIEGDHSSAAFLYAAAWLLKKEIEVQGLREDSRQGDRIFPDLLQRLESGKAEYFLRDTPDLVPPLAACALFSPGGARIEGIGHLRYKESDRIGVLASELKKVGAVLRVGPDFMEIDPLEASRPAAMDPHGDHRMAMAFGLLSLRIPGVEIADRSCVGKSFPDFWKCLNQIAENI